MPRYDRERAAWLRRRFALFALIPIGLLLLFRLDSSWAAIAVGGVVAVAAILGMGLWAQSGFNGIDLRDIRLFFRRESWGLGPKKRP